MSDHLSVMSASSGLQQAALTAHRPVDTVGLILAVGGTSGRQHSRVKNSGKYPRLRTDRRRMAAGFTMVELLVTVMLAAILLAMGVPMFRDSIVRNRLTGQARELAAAVTLARSQGITENRNMSFCRADSDAATACAGSADEWQFWIIVDADGAVVRRGRVSDYQGTLVTTSTLSSDQVAFGADGLARTGGALIAGQQVLICSSEITTENQRLITLGVGSRISTERVTGAC